jgi:hypothetical protein
VALRLSQYNGWRCLDDHKYCKVEQRKLHSFLFFSSHVIKTKKMFGDKKKKFFFRSSLGCFNEPQIFFVTTACILPLSMRFSCHERSVRVKVS